MSSAHTTPNLPTRSRMPFAVEVEAPRTGRLLTMPAAHQPEPTPPAAMLRAPSPEQGRALELLGRAIEYLVDEHLHRNRGEAMDSDAVRLLMAHNRAIFAQCPVAQPWGSRLRQWMTSIVAA